jgi:hypothetical protein
VEHRHRILQIRESAERFEIDRVAGSGRSRLDESDPPMSGYMLGGRAFA